MKFKELFSKENIMKTWPVWVSGLILGTIIQLNWISGGCSGEPFLGSELKKCQDNILRVLLGGPLVTLVFIGLFFAELKILFKSFNPKNTQAKEKIFKRTAFAYLPFAFSILMPVIGYGDGLIYLVLILGIAINLVMVSDVRLSSDYGGVSFDMKGSDTMSVSFIGKCIEKNKDSLYEGIIDMLPQIPTVGKMTINLDQAEKIDSQCKELVSILEQSAKVYKLKVNRKDPKKLLR